MADYGRGDEVIVFVTYQGDAQSRFDRDYYTKTHLPLLRCVFGPHGLISAQAFFPALAVHGTIAICELRFRDEDALRASYASPELPGLAADVGRFTDIMPVQMRATRF